jgi:lysozyme family protein
VTTVDSSPTVSYPPAFVRAVNRLLVNEGGYINNSSDRGGETKYGICKRDYPAVDIALLKREQAIEIYYRDWWVRFRYSALPGPIGAKLFDLAVNIGPEPATRCLQRALRACGQRVEEDGALGTETSRGAAAANQLVLMAALRSEAAGHYRLVARRDGGRSGDEDDNEFLRGWLNRAYE